MITFGAIAFVSLQVLRCISSTILPTGFGQEAVSHYSAAPRILKAKKSESEKAQGVLISSNLVLHVPGVVHSKAGNEP